MSPSANLALPFIEAAQAQKHVTHNEALQRLDTLVQLAVLDRDLAAPPASPAEGQRWIIAASPSGAWAGHAGHVAAWQDGSWEFSAARTGWTAFVVDEGLLVTWNGAAWVNALGAFTPSYQGIGLFGLGTTADAANPFSAKLNNALWAAKTTAEGGTGDLRYKLSKEAAGKTLSLLLQTGFSGRAEIGLTGDDDLHFKVSGDGSTFADALVLKASTGQAQLAAGSAVAPALSFSARPGDGLWLPAGGSLAWSLLGAEAARMTAAGLGVGGPPARKLDVFGTVRASGDAEITSTTASTSSTTGALKVAGGIGVAGTGNFGGSVGATSFASNAPATAAWTVDGSLNPITVAQNSATNFPSGAGLVILTNANNAESAIYLVSGGIAILIAQTGASFVAGLVAPAGKTDVGLSGSSHAIANNTGASTTYYLATIRTRPIT